MMLIGQQRLVRTLVLLFCGKATRQLTFVASLPLIKRRLCIPDFLVVNLAILL